MRFNLYFGLFCLFLLFSCADSGSFSGGFPSSPVGQANVFVMDQLSVSLLEEVPSGFFDSGDGINLQLDPGSGSPWLVFKKVYLYKVPESGLSGGLVDHTSNGWLDFVVKSSPSCFDDENYAFLNLQDESCCGGSCEEVLVEFLDAEINLPSDLETGEYLLFFAVGEADENGNWDVWNWVFEEITVHGEDWCEPVPATCGSGDDQDVLTSCINNHLISTECENSCQDSGNGAFCGCFDATQDPIPLCSCGDLQNVNSNVNANYEMQNDIDCSDTVNWDKDGDGVAEGFNPIRFSGVFDGQDNVIKNLYINRHGMDYVGLFGKTEGNAFIRFVGLEGGNINGMEYVGGLVGENFDGTIFKSYYSGSVNGQNNVGGLVGKSSFGITLNSYASGIVSGNSNVAGLIGKNSGEIENSYAIVDVKGNSNVGGLVGESYEDIENSYASGIVSGNSNVGGLVGISYWGQSSNSFWDTDTSGMSSSASGEGKTTAQLKDQSTYPESWDFTKTWMIDENINEGYPYLQPDEIKKECNINYLRCGTGTSHNFLTTCVDRKLNRMKCGNGCQDNQDKSFCISCFDSTQDPIPLCNCEDLQRMNENMGANYELQNDIDCSDTVNWDKDGDGVAEGFEPINFGGVFDGQGHVIWNLYINRPNTDSVGLFGRNTNNIMDVGIEGGEINGFNRVGGLAGLNDQGVISRSYAIVDVSGNGNLVGGLVGWNHIGSVSSSYGSGSVNGISHVGGLVGGNTQSGSVSSSYGSGSVSGDEYVGGLAGFNDRGVISSSYGSGSVNGNSNVGGLLGQNYHGSVSSSFWDIDSSGISSSSGGEGKTSAQMKDQSSYPDAWDFTSVWAISSDVNEGYPHLQLVQPIEQGCNNADLKCGVGEEQGFLTICVDKNLHSFECAGGCQDSEDGASCMSCFDAAQDPIPLCNCDDLQRMNEDVTANYQLQNNIDCSDTVNWNVDNYGVAEGFKPNEDPGNPFIGSFDGQDYVIWNLYINRPGMEYIGLFGSTDYDMVISDVGIVGGEISGKEYVGGLVGDNRGVVSGSYFSGIVKGYKEVGGLVGENSRGTISSSYSLGSVSGSGSIGGLVGENEGRISSSYSLGGVSGDEYVGGLVGNNDRGSISSSYGSGSVNGGSKVGGLVGQNYFESISNSYASGSVSGTGENIGGLVGENEGGSTSNSFWDTVTSNQPSSAGGDGKTTIQLKDQSSYPESWDFTNIWAISPDINNGYPYLQSIEQS